MSWPQQSGGFKLAPEGIPRALPASVQGRRLAGAGSSPASVADTAQVVPIDLHALRFAARARTRTDGDPALVAAGFKGS